VRKKDEEKAKTIKSVFEKCADGISYQGIADSLGLSKSTVQHILNRKIYVTQGFVSAKLFKRAKQSILAKKAKPKKKLVRLNWSDPRYGWFNTLFPYYYCEVTGKREGKLCWGGYDSKTCWGIYSLLKKRRDKFFTIIELYNLVRQRPQLIRIALRDLENAGLVIIHTSKKKGRIVRIKASKELLNCFEETRDAHNDLRVANINRIIEKHKKMNTLPTGGERQARLRLKKLLGAEM